MLTFHRGWRQFSQWAWQYQALLFIICLGVLSRLLPHPDNVTPLAAMGLFAGAYVPQRIYLWVPVVAALLSDLAGPGLYHPLIMILVYAGLMLSSLIGKYLLHDRAVFRRLPVAVIAASLGFYLISNLGAWWVHYPHTAGGLAACYVNGLPYLLRTLAGDAVYALVFFGSFEVFRTARRRWGYA